MISWSRRYPKSNFLESNQTKSNWTEGFSQSDNIAMSTVYVVAMEPRTITAWRLKRRFQFTKQD